MIKTGFQFLHECIEVASGNWSHAVYYGKTTEHRLLQTLDPSDKRLNEILIPIHIITKSIFLIFQDPI